MPMFRRQSPYHRNPTTPNRRENIPIQPLQLDTGSSPKPAEVSITPMAFVICYNEWIAGIGLVLQICQARPWIYNHIKTKLSDTIAHPCSSFNCGSVEQLHPTCSNGCNYLPVFNSLLKHINESEWDFRHPVRLVALCGHKAGSS